RRHTISKRDWSSDVCSSDLLSGPCPLKVHSLAGRSQNRRAGTDTNAHHSTDRCTSSQNDPALCAAGMPMRYNSALHLLSAWCVLLARCETQRGGRCENECRQTIQRRKSSYSSSPEPPCHSHGTNVPREQLASHLHEPIGTPSFSRHA